MIRTPRPASARIRKNVGSLLLLAILFVLAIAWLYFANGYASGSGNPSSTGYLHEAIRSASLPPPPVQTEPPSPTGIPPSPTITPTFTPTTPPGPSCPAAYQDLPPGSNDFIYAHCATCANIMDTFACGSPGEPCVPPNNYPYFRPTFGFAGTRGLVAKTISQAAGFADPQTEQIFEDVPLSHPLFVYIGRMTVRGYMNGFPCGGPGEPCLPPNNLPYFRPDGNVTRGQFAKILSNTADFTEPPGSQLFEDVPVGSTFYDYIQRLANRLIMVGFPCGGPGEPCIPPQNRPYFRPNDNTSTISRIQYTRHLLDTFPTGCLQLTPTVTPTITTTRTPAPSVTATSTGGATRTPTPTATHFAGDPCPAEYQDLPSSAPGFGYVHCATCAGILETYDCGHPGEPCIGPNNYPYFRPTVGYVGTRADVAKTLSIAAGFIGPRGSGPIFQDVPPSHPYYPYIQEIGSRGIDQGFPCGGPGEPCVPPANLPYYRPAVVAVRGEFARFLANTAGFVEPHTDQIFTDVPIGHPYYIFVERVASRGLMLGFPCGGPGEPCDPTNRPYFRPGDLLTTVSRLEYATILVNTFLPGCPLSLTPSPTVTVTPSSTATGTPTGTPTSTPSPTSANTATNIPASTSSATFTATPTTQPVIETATATSCPIHFTDVPQGSTFYTFVRCLACRGIINGYSDGTFRPNNLVTRGQLSKIVANSAGFSEPHTDQLFEDVPTTHPFYIYIERLASRGYISGYQCGNPEPCVSPGNRPYFRSGNNATRGQISKIVSNAAGFTEPHTEQTFEDVPPGSTFYDFIERLASRGVMGGYPCNTPPAGPCVPPANLPYFVPNNNATRGQTSKIVANTFFPGCQP